MKPVIISTHFLVIWRLPPQQDLAPSKQYEHHITVGYHPLTRKLHDTAKTVTIFALTRNRPDVNGYRAYTATRTAVSRVYTHIITSETVVFMVTDGMDGDCDAGQTACEWYAIAGRNVNTTDAGDVVCPVQGDDDVVCHRNDGFGPCPRNGLSAASVCVSLLMGNTMLSESVACDDRPLCRRNGGRTPLPARATERPITDVTSGPNTRPDDKAPRGTGNVIRARGHAGAQILPRRVVALSPTEARETGQPRPPRVPKPGTGRRCGGGSHECDDQGRGLNSGSTGTSSREYLYIVYGCLADVF